MMLADLIIKSAETGFYEQNSDGSMPAGHNGPHRDPETPVRNTSHWLIFFLLAYKLSSEKKFEAASEKCLRYLESDKARPMNATFFHRFNREKDFSNGVMGQAWTMEALIYGYKHFKYEKTLKIAEDIFNIHPYDRTLQCWKTVNVDGSIRGFDSTFNHQLWFASIGCRLISEGINSAKESTLHFIDHITDNLETYPDGVISHYPYGYSKPETFRRKVGRFIHKVKNRLSSQKAQYFHSLGYHGFNTYALSVIYESFPDIDLFQSDTLKQTIELFSDRDFEKNMVNTKFGYPYNPPGIEAAVSIEKMGVLPIDDKKKLILRWLQNQFDNSFNYSTYRMGKNTSDPVTLQARLYELYRLSDFDYDIIITEN